MRQYSDYGVRVVDMTDVLEKVVMRLASKSPAFKNPRTTLSRKVMRDEDRHKILGQLMGGEMSPEDVVSVIDKMNR